MTLPDLGSLSREDERLRWTAADEPAVEAAAFEAEQQLREGGADQVRLLGYLGNAYRLLGRHTEAVETHERARDHAAAAGEPRVHAVALVRLGESYRGADRYGDAEAALREALEIAPPEVAHYALQHLGKTLLDGGATADAREVLEEALRQRRAAGKEELVRSSERALAVARSSA
jgi:tetratricopeptide (TPR) repeat protein